MIIYRLEHFNGEVTLAYESEMPRKTSENTLLENLAIFCSKNSIEKITRIDTEEMKEDFIISCIIIRE